MGNLQLKASTINYSPVQMHVKVSCQGESPEPFSPSVLPEAVLKSPALTTPFQPMSSKSHTITLSRSCRTYPHIFPLTPKQMLANLSPELVNGWGLTTTSKLSFWPWNCTVKATKGYLWTSLSTHLTFTLCAAPSASFWTRLSWIEITFWIYQQMMRPPLNTYWNMVLSGLIRGSLWYIGDLNQDPCLHQQALPLEMSGFPKAPEGWSRPYSYLWVMGGSTRLALSQWAGPTQTVPAPCYSASNHFLQAL